MERKSRRHSLRLQRYNYSGPGAYFITICAHQRRCLFGEVKGGLMNLNELGQIIMASWRGIPSHSASVELDAFVVMPNHLHGIVMIKEGEMNRAATDGIEPCVGAQFIAPAACHASLTLGQIVRGFKARSTVAIRKFGRLRHEPLWQRNYYEHVIRSELSLNSIREYIENNPAQWDMDRENPNFNNDGSES